MIRINLRIAGGILDGLQEALDVSDSLIHELRGGTAELDLAQEQIGDLVNHIAGLVEEGQQLLDQVLDQWGVDQLPIHEQTNEINIWAYCFRPVCSNRRLVLVYLAQRVMETVLQEVADVQLAHQTVQETTRLGDLAAVSVH